MAWLHMTASAAGCKLQRWDTDYDGVDATVHASAAYYRQSSARVDVQLKCTQRQDYLHADYLSFPLERKHYTALADPERDAPMLLGVLLVPPDPIGWLEHDEQRLLAKSCMYYSLAADWEPIADDAASKTVRLPRSNRLDVTALLQILQDVASARAA